MPETRSGQKRRHSFHQDAGRRSFNGREGRLTRSAVKRRRARIVETDDEDDFVQDTRADARASEHFIVPGKFHGCFASKTVYDVVSQFDDRKMDLMRKIGLGGLAWIRQGMTHNRRLIYWLQSRMNLENMSIRLGDGSEVKMDDDSVHGVMGVSKEGNRVRSGDVEFGSQAAARLRKYLKVTGRVITPTLEDARQVLLEKWDDEVTTEEEDCFVVALAAFVCGYMFGPRDRTASIPRDIMDFLSKPNQVRKANWSKYILEVLHMSALKVQYEMKKSPSSILLGGCWLYLELLYADSIDLGGLNIPLSWTPRIRVYSKKKLAKCLLGDQDPGTKGSATQFGISKARQWSERDNDPEPEELSVPLHRCHVPQEQKYSNASSSRNVPLHVPGRHPEVNETIVLDTDSDDNEANIDIIGFFEEGVQKVEDALHDMTKKYHAENKRIYEQQTVYIDKGSADISRLLAKHKEEMRNKIDEMMSSRTKTNLASTERTSNGEHSGAADANDDVDLGDIDEMLRDPTFRRFGRFPFHVMEEDHSGSSFSGASGHEDGGQHDDIQTVGSANLLHGEITAGEQVDSALTICPDQPAQNVNIRVSIPISMRQGVATRFHIPRLDDLLKCKLRAGGLGRSSDGNTSLRCSGQGSAGSVCLTVPKIVPRETIEDGILGTQVGCVVPIARRNFSGEPFRNVNICLSIPLPVIQGLVRGNLPRIDELLQRKMGTQVYQEHMNSFPGQYQVRLHECKDNSRKRAKVTFNPTVRIIESSSATHADTPRSRRWGGSLCKQTVSRPKSPVSGKRLFEDTCLSDEEEYESKLQIVPSEVRDATPISVVKKSNFFCRSGFPPSPFELNLQHRGTAWVSQKKMYNKAMKCTGDDLQRVWFQHKIPTMLTLIGAEIQHQFRKRVMVQRTLFEAILRWMEQLDADMYRKNNLSHHQWRHFIPPGFADKALKGKQYVANDEVDVMFTGSHRRTSMDKARLIMLPSFHTGWWVLYVWDLKEKRIHVLDPVKNYSSTEELMAYHKDRIAALNDALDVVKERVFNCWDERFADYKDITYHSKLNKDVAEEDSAFFVLHYMTQFDGTRVLCHMHRASLMETRQQVLYELLTMKGNNATLPDVLLEPVTMLD